MYELLNVMCEQNGAVYDADHLEKLRAAFDISVDDLAKQVAAKITPKLALMLGEAPDGPDIRGAFIFNGGLFTVGHTHPWYTTPMLRRLPNRARRRVGRPFAPFKRMPGVRKMWSKGYQVTDAELGELHSAMDRHDGLFYLAAAAGFVADHQAQGDRLDFGPLFQAYRDQFPFLVGGSDEDPFEHRQVDLARERLGNLGLRIERLPGGHLTTHEQLEALAALIAKFEQGRARKPEQAEDHSD